MKIKLITLSSFFEKLQETPTYLTIKNKWDELDLQSRFYLKIAGLSLIGLLFFTMFLSSLTHVNQLKKDFNEKKDLLKFMQTSSEELRILKQKIPQASIRSASDSSSWSAYIETLANVAGIEPAQLSLHLGTLKPPQNLSRETEIELSVKQINLKQMLRFTYSLEHGQRPLQIQKLSIQTHEDRSGYLDITLLISAFTLLEPSL